MTADAPLAHELGKHGIAVECEKRLAVMYDGFVVGDFFADMIVQDSILIQNNAVQALSISHGIQIVNHLTVTGIDEGLLLNFGADRLQFKRKNRGYRSPTADFMKLEPVVGSRSVRTSRRSRRG